MSQLTANQFAGAAQWCLVANTPMYLYRHLRSDPFVQSIGANKPTEEIIKRLSFYAGEGAGEDEAPVALYALLIALSFKPLAEYAGFLAEFNPPVRWIADLRGIIHENATVNRIITVNPAVAPVMDETRSPVPTRKIVLG